MNKRRDVIAEQSLAATLRRFIKGNLTLSFPTYLELVAMEGGDVEGAKLIVNPPLCFLISRNSPDGRYTIRYNTPVPGDDIQDDKTFAVYLAVALRGFEQYEAALLAEIGERARLAQNGNKGGGNNGSGGIILP